MNGKIKFGLVGVGVPRKDPKWKANMHYPKPSIAWIRYLPQISSNPRAEIRAICDVVEERLEEVKKVYKVKEVYSDYKDMLEKSDVDVVVIITPNNLHYPMAMDAIKAGKHLIVEKPISTSFEEANNIVQSAKKAGVKFMPAPWVFDDCFYKIREMIDSKFLGKICLIKAKAGHMGPGHSEWFYTAGYGAGVTFDIAVYPVTTFTALLGPARNVWGVAGTAIEKRLVTDHEIPVQVEDNEIIALDFGNGTLGDITCNYCTQISYGPTLEIYGSDGTIFVENGHLKFLASQERIKGLLTSKMPLEMSFPNEPIVEFFVNHMLEDIDMNYLGEQQVHVIEILEKALKSSKTGKKLGLTTSFNSQEFAKKKR